MPPIIPTRGISPASAVRTFVSGRGAPSGATSEVASTGEGVVEALLGQVQEVAIDQCDSVSCSNLGSTAIASASASPFEVVHMLAEGSTAHPRASTAPTKRIALDVHPSHTVGCIKAMLQEREGIPAEHQNITFAKKGLPDACNIYDVGTSVKFDQQSPMMVLTLRLCSNSNLECNSSVRLPGQVMR